MESVVGPGSWKSAKLLRNTSSDWSPEKWFVNSVTVVFFLFVLCIPESTGGSSSQRESNKSQKKS